MKNDRFSKIISLLENSGTLSVKELSNILNVSEMTIRRDAILLEEKGIAFLKHGKIMLNVDLIDSSQINVRDSDKKYSLEKAGTHRINEKRRIANHAASLVMFGDSIIIDNGTTMNFLADELKKDEKITVLTCNFTVASQLVRCENIELLITGGNYHRSTGMMTGSQAIDIIRQTRANIAFISTLGIHEKLGVTCSNTYEIEAKKAMMESSSKTVLLADSSKFGKLVSYHFADIDQFDMIISDVELDKVYIELINEMGIELKLV